MSDDGFFGNLVLATEVEDAAIATLQAALPVFLARVSRKIGQPSDWLQIPRSYVVSNDSDHWPEEQLPSIAVGSSGTIGKPLRDSQYYRAKFHLKVAVYVSSNTRENVERLAKYYGGAIREVITHNPSLGDFAEGVDWDGEQYDIREPDRTQRTLGSAVNEFTVDVRDVVRRFGGTPNIPPPVEPGDPPIATNVTVTLEPESLT